MPTEPHADRRRASWPALTGVAIMAALGAAFVAPRVATATLASVRPSAALVGVGTVRDGTEHGRTTVASLTRGGGARVAALAREHPGHGDGNAADDPKPTTSATDPSSAGSAPATQDATSSSASSADPKPGHGSEGKKDKKDQTTRSPAEETGSATSTGDPPSSGDSGAGPVPVLNPAPPSASPPVGSGQLAAGPSRVPDPGSQPRAEPAPAPAAELPTGTVAAGWTPFLPGREVGIRLFVAGLIALMVAIAGLVTVAVRRRP